MKKSSLDRVLELKRRREQAIAGRLAEARARAEEAQRTAAAIEALRQESEAQWLVAAESPNRVGALQNASFVRDRLDDRLEEARTALRTAEAEVDACLSEFQAALQDRRALDRLKERRMETVVAAESRAEQMATDAVALARFVRGETRAMGGAS